MNANGAAGMGGRGGMYPQPAGMGGGTVINEGMKPCVRCEGKGFCHDSSMTHDKPHGEKCFFCKSCVGCGGRGMIQGGSAVIHGGGSSPFAPMGGQTVINQGRQPCVRCEGKGFCHNSSMTHDKPHGEKCFFCETCVGCGGCGMVEGGSAVISGGGGYSPFNPIGGGTTVINTGPARCARCDGHGFCHDSSMNHDKGPGEKCFFCTECPGCRGRGMQ